MKSKLDKGMMHKKIFGVITVVSLLFALPSCVQTNENSPGYEYMPDMYRSPAIEAFLDYGEIRDTVRENLNNTLSARYPVKGTVPHSESKINDMPYPYPDTQEGYERAGKELTSPIKPTARVIQQGKIIYGNYCVHCHGGTGKGDGRVVTNGGHPAPPAYDGPQLKDLPPGKMFHTITYGKGVMGSHASQLHKVERWKVIAYVRTLQGTLEKPKPSSSQTGSAKSANDSTKVPKPEMDNPTMESDKKKQDDSGSKQPG